MHITIDDTDYAAIRNLVFSPRVDLALSRLPINEFQADIRTRDSFEPGEAAALYDDLDVLWAHYRIMRAQRLDANTVRITAESDLGLLDRVMLDAVYYNNWTVRDVLDNTIIQTHEGLSAPWPYRLDSAFDSATVTGFCPRQSARERLLWICFTLGAYVKSFFNDRLEILPIGETRTPIPIGDTYWKPTVRAGACVTAVRVKYYAFAQGTPDRTDRYVVDSEGDTYIVTESESVLYNPDAPAAAPENMVSVEGVYLLNSQNVGGVLAHLAKWYFGGAEVVLDAIDDAAYLPGDLVLAHTGEAELRAGYIRGARFRFGVRAMARLELTAAQAVPSAALTIDCVWGDVLLDRRAYRFPVGYGYSVANPYTDMAIGAHRYVFRPQNAAATGTIAAGENTSVQPCDAALDLHENILYIISVDEATDNDGIVVIT